MAPARRTPPRSTASVVPKSAVDGELKDISANKPYVKAFDQQQQQQPGGPGQIEGTSPGTFSSAFVADLLTQRIEYAMIHQEDQRRHALPDSAAVAQASRGQPGPDGPEQQRRLADPAAAGVPGRYQNTLVQRRADLDALRNDLGKPFTDQDLQQFYDTNQDQFVTEICVRHILVADQATATQLQGPTGGRGGLRHLAKADSTDTGSAANGGQLSGSAPDGCLTNQDVSQLVTQFAQAMVALPVNQVSQPVQSQFGFHLIEVTARTVEPYDQSVAQAARQSAGPAGVPQAPRQAGPAVVGQGRPGIRALRQDHRQLDRAAQGRRAPEGAATVDQRPAAGQRRIADPGHDDARRLIRRWPDVSWWSASGPATRVC